MIVQKRYRECRVGKSAPGRREQVETRERTAPGYAHDLVESFG